MVQFVHSRSNSSSMLVQIVQELNTQTIKHDQLGKNLVNQASLIQIPLPKSCHLAPDDLVVDCREVKYWAQSGMQYPRDNSDF